MRVSKVIQFFLVLLILILVWPILLLIGLGVFLFGGGWPIIFKQKRIGHKGKPFIIYKFRTMVKGAEKKRRQYIHLNQADGPVFKIKDDPRFTQLGRFLSHAGLDELPQLFNVLKGEMNLVGPRPLPVYEARQLKKWQCRREEVEPGIFSPWLFNGYHKSSFEDWMNLDIKYIENKTPFLDLYLVTRGFFLGLKLFLKEVLSQFLLTRIP